MKCKLWLALLPALCLCRQISPARVQQSLDVNTSEITAAMNQSVPCAKGSSVATGRIAGVIKDQSGAVVPGVKVEALSLVSGIKRSLVSDSQGRFVFDRVPVGRNQVTAIAIGFEIIVLHDVSVIECGEATIIVVLKIAPARTVVEVNAPEIGAGAAISHPVNESDRARSRNTAELLGNTPGVSLRENGQLASIPFLHGLGDERAKLVVDGMTLSSSCPNHMNPPLSSISPSNAAKITVMTGITPVSLGGDSIGGTVSVDSQPPVFAGPGERLHSETVASGFYRSNGEYYGGSFAEWVTGHKLGIGYSGSWATNSDYADGSGHRITSTYAQTTDHTVTLAAQGAHNLLVLEGSLHHTPYEGFVNAQMDLVRNYAESLNLHYRRNFGQGVLDARVYWQGSWHSMNIGRDKSTFPMAMGMPMNTHGKDLGYSVKVELPLSARHTLGAGNELHRFVLDDHLARGCRHGADDGPQSLCQHQRRPPHQAGQVCRSRPASGIRNGPRSSACATIPSGPMPVRCEGYSAMMYAADADAFNALNRAHADVDLDATALARYEPKHFQHLRVWLRAQDPRAQPIRALCVVDQHDGQRHDRLVWRRQLLCGQRSPQAGDCAHRKRHGNLARPRSATHWEIKVTPYMTYIQSYVDVDTLAIATYGMSTFAQLRFANHNARIYGSDLSGNGSLWSSARFGQGKISGIAGWLHGERLDTQTGLYQMMPLDLRVAFDEELKGFRCRIRRSGRGSQIQRRSASL